MANFLALVLVIVAAVLGAIGLPWLTVLALAVAGTIIYMMMRQMHFMRAAQEGRTVALVAMACMTQCVTMGALFGIGRLVGSAFGA